MAGGDHEERSLSDKKKSRLQALERRLSTTPPPRKAVFSPAATSAALASSSKLRDSGLDVNDPTYAKLCQTVSNGPIATYMQLSTIEDGGAIINSMLHELVESNKKSVRDISNVLDTRIQDRVLLLDNPAGQGKAVERARKRARASLGKRSKKHMSMRQHKLHGSFTLPPRYHKYNLFLPMHEMWKKYANSLVEDISKKMIEPCLLQADLHGAILAVVQAKNISYTGLQGIMIRETENTFALVTSKDRLHVVPKPGSIFMFQLENLRVTLVGDHLSARKLNTEKM